MEWKIHPGGGCLPKLLFGGKKWTEINIPDDETKQNWREQQSLGKTDGKSTLQGITHTGNSCVLVAKEQSGREERKQGSCIGWPGNRCGGLELIDDSRPGIGLAAADALLDFCTNTEVFKREKKQCLKSFVTLQVDIKAGQVLKLWPTSQIRCFDWCWTASG